MSQFKKMSQSTNCHILLDVTKKSYSPHYPVFRLLASLQEDAGNESQISSLGFLVNWTHVQIRFFYLGSRTEEMGLNFDINSVIA